MLPSRPSARRPRGPTKPSGRRKSPIREFTRPKVTDSVVFIVELNDFSTGAFRLRGYLSRLFPIQRLARKALDAAHPLPPYTDEHGRPCPRVRRAGGAGQPRRRALLPDL